LTASSCGERRLEEAKIYIRFYLPSFSKKGREVARILKIYRAHTCLMNTQFFKNRSKRSVESMPGTRGGDSAARKAQRRTSNAKAAAQAEKVERYARAQHHVLLTGERGTGKTTIARQIHDKSSRRHKQFVSLNCATLKEELVEAELFGYEKGAFTGANQAKAGLFETGSGGTVFLDEVGELSLSLQAKLLKAVEEKRIRRVGAATEIPVDLRVIAATSRNLREMTEKGEFRHDLFDRLNVLSLDTIPLREQKFKIRDLVLTGLERERVALGRKSSFQMEPLAFVLLEDYAWTGNFRELQNFVLKLATEFFDAGVITASHVRTLLAEKGATFQNPETSEENLSAADAAENRLIIEINLGDRLDDIIEQVKESYIRHHLQDKSMRRMAKQCGVSRYLITRIADKMETSQYR
jgi:transcriptional regulator with PAS, ATPase and Fis domain